MYILVESVFLVLWKKMYLFFLFSFPHPFKVFPSHHSYIWIAILWTLSIWDFKTVTSRTHPTWKQRPLHMIFFTVILLFSWCQWGDNVTVNRKTTDLIFLYVAATPTHRPMMLILWIYYMCVALDCFVTRCKANQSAASGCHGWKVIGQKRIALKEVRTVMNLYSFELTLAHIRHTVHFFQCV